MDTHTQRHHLTAKPLNELEISQSGGALSVSEFSYTPPTTADLQALKQRLNFTGEEMAALALLAGGHQWRKYTGGAQPREMGAHMLFFIAARLALSDAELKKVTRKMRSIGADIAGI